MNDPSTVLISGPLAVSRDDFVAEAFRLGYAKGTVVAHLLMIARLSRWMARMGIGVEDLSWQVLREYCGSCGLSGPRRPVPRPILQMVAFLAPSCVPAENALAGEGFPASTAVLLRSFAAYLRMERSLARSTVSGHLFYARKFVRWFLDHRGNSLTAVTVADVNLFVVGKMPQWSTQSVTSAMSSLRVLFGWMFLTGSLDHDLARGLCGARKRPQSSVPKALPSRDIAAILAVETPLRDHAMLLLLARLGLRSCEVSRLCLDDFDWRAGTIQISGKRNDLQSMPLPAEVGEAISAYLQGRRTSAVSGRHVFLTSNAPYRQLSSAAITTLVTKTAAKAEIPGRIGAHRLRHSAATGVLGAGGTLSEAGQLLRHRSGAVTAVYAKVAQSALVPVARPWADTSKKAGTR